ncbi:type II and III secretion system protein family protein [Phenylobacterium aquaticum]|jgi:pilus assembly protein CpaC|uniref:type II and III secretion system protein family protein n=1 Tax=Phenylobacterium aquaticum TaxID=1763816 RepID=UPI0030142631
MMLRRLALILSLAWIALAPASALAQAGLSGGPPSAGAPIRVDVSAPGGASQNLSIPQGKSAIVELPVDVRDILVSNPAVADAMLRSPRRIFILGVKAGSTDAVFFDAAGRRVLSLAIRVDQDTSAVAQTINRVLPGASVRVDAINSSLILSGQVANISDADKAVQIAKASVDRPDTQVLNMLGVAGKDQVMLKVRVVEIQRNSIKQLGFNLSAVLGQVGEAQYLLSNAASFGVNGSLLGGLSGGYTQDTTKQPTLQMPCTGSGWPTGSLCSVVTRDSTAASNYNTATVTNTAGSAGVNSAEATIKAFERVGLARTLAEPNLTAVSGESAKFLAGGEYPIPVSQDDKGHITVEYKPFGVGLGFTPIVLSGGRISLKISTEVSELSTSGSFSIASSSTSSSLTIPALNVRRAETSVEMPSGGSMMIAGLLKEETKQAFDSLPGVTTLPVLGALFRSRDYLSGETELVIIVTPYIVQPVSPDRLQTPADGMKIANDAQTILLGQLTKAYKAKPQPPTGRAYQGPIGYVIE